ncbi:MAG: hypothetical protein LVQ95_05340 [Candidatus Micrarchaeales archaeon]|nr:hypothetical protein [Candidatus Micrarchaeales archaeon]
MINAKTRAQSAMEYLMTYGWAIIIILVVLGILYLLNVFTPNSLIGSVCTPQFKYVCQTPVLAADGQLSFLFGQNTGATEYNLAFACTAGSNLSSGQPYVAGGGNPWEYLGADGSLSNTYSQTNAYVLYTNKFVYINGITCYDINGIALKGSAVISNGHVLEFQSYASAIIASTTTSTTTTAASTSVPSQLAVGTPFTGTIWLKYTNGPGRANTTSNPYIVTQAATVSTRISSSQSSSTTSTTTTVAASAPAQKA